MKPIPLLLHFVFLLLCVVLNGNGQESTKWMPVAVVSKSSALPPALSVYKPVMETLLKEISAATPPKHNLLGIIPQLTVKNFMEYVGMPLPGTREITVYEITHRGLRIKDTTVQCLVVRFLPGNLAGKDFFNAGIDVVHVQMDVLKKSTKEAELNKWAERFKDTDYFMGVAPCAVAVFTLRSDKDPEWVLAESAIQKEFAWLRMVGAF
jgi:hypothetical protein